MPSAPEPIRKRGDFLACARARRAGSPSLTLQARNRGDGGAVRVGYTCSRKVGNAVARNRAKRRLRAAAAEVLTCYGRPGWDYVLIGKAGATALRPFAGLIGDLERSLAHVHRERS